MDFPVGVDTAEECKELLRKKTRPYNLPVINVAPYKEYNSGILLRIKDNGVLLYCSNPRWATVPNEAFYGKIVCRCGKVFIHGKIGPTYQTCFRFGFYVFGSLFMTWGKAWFMGVLWIWAVIIFFGFELRREPYPANRQAIFDLLNCLEHIDP